MPSTKFGSVRLTVREQITIEDFQDGRGGSYLGYRNKIVLSILNLHVGPMPPVNCDSFRLTIREQIWFLPASVAQLDAPSDWRPGNRGFNTRRGRQHSFVETDHEIFSTVILSLPLIQEGQLSVSGERMCTILVYHLED